MEKRPVKALAGDETGKATDSAPPVRINPEDLGLPIELQGRISRIVQLQPHTREGLMEILSRPATSPLTSLEELLKGKGRNMTLHADVKERMVEQALKSGLGARALNRYAHRITEEILWQTKTDGNQIINLPADLFAEEKDS